MARQVKGSGLDVGNNSLQNVFNNIVNDTKDVPPVAEVKTESGIESKVVSIDLLDEDENFLTDMKISEHLEIVSRSTMITAVFTFMSAKTVIT